MLDTNVQLDWTAYWEEFKKAHGGDPVEHRGRLLFYDGWTYSASDTAGPEWRPPQEPSELEMFQVAYWKTKRNLLSQEHAALIAQIESLEKFQFHKDVPLQAVTSTMDVETGQKVLSSDPIDFEAMRGRLDWLASEIRRSEEELKNIGDSDG